MKNAMPSRSSDSKPHILCLAHRVPYPPNRGDRIRTFHVLERLAQDARVHLAFTAFDSLSETTRRKLSTLCERFVAAPIDGRRKWLSAAWSVATGRSATEGLFRSDRLRSTLEAWTRETRFDAVVVICSSMVQYLDLPALRDVPTVVDLVDVDSQKWFDYARHAWGAKRLLLNLEARRLRRIESSLLDRVDAVTVVAEREAEVYASFTGRRPAVIPNGVNLDYFRPQEEDTNDGPPHCVFVGALDYAANVDGAAWFCHEVWPRVRERHPEAVFRLVGSRPNQLAHRLGRLKGVELVGEVPDVRPYLHAAGVVVVPLRVARGVQNKVLESLAAGKATVVSPQALCGIDAASQIELVCAENAQEWTDAICALLDDPARRAGLGRAGRAFVEAKYRWSAQLSKLDDLPGLGPVLTGPETADRLDDPTRGHVSADVGS